MARALTATSRRWATSATSYSSGCRCACCWQACTRCGAFGARAATSQAAWPGCCRASLGAGALLAFVNWFFLLLPVVLNVPVRLRGQEMTRELFIGEFFASFQFPQVFEAANLMWLALALFFAGAAAARAFAAAAARRLLPVAGGGDGAGPGCGRADVANDPGRAGTGCSRSARGRRGASGLDANHPHQRGRRTDGRGPQAVAGGCQPSSATVILLAASCWSSWPCSAPSCSSCSCRRPWPRLMMTCCGASASP